MTAGELAALVNRLPTALRRYIHDLETRCDPAGEVRERIFLLEENAALRAMIAELKEDR